MGFSAGLTDNGQRLNAGRLQEVGKADATGHIIEHHSAMASLLRQKKHQQVDQGAFTCTEHSDDVLNALDGENLISGNGLVTAHQLHLDAPGTFFEMFSSIVRPLEQGIKLHSCSDQIIKRERNRRFSGWSIGCFRNGRTRQSADSRIQSKTTTAFVVEPNFVFTGRSGLVLPFPDRITRTQIIQIPEMQRIALRRGLRKQQAGRIKPICALILGNVTILTQMLVPFAL
ncbi:MAG: hypothetical protein BWY82_02279 [Verrucomicrobia bacterium ADurb.Bin474]|nr:MAG: hypothetical protein BWY82_02279 [Verrucomicrobia bacterium ADurb.Bin474]